MGLSGLKGNGFVVAFILSKFKILKVSKVVGSGSLAVGPSMSKLEADEFAKVNAELVEVGETDKNLAAALKDADLLLYGGVPFTDAMLKAAPKCVAVLFQTVGYDAIDMKVATCAS